MERDFKKLKANVIDGSFYVRLIEKMGENNVLDMNSMKSLIREVGSEVGEYKNPTHVIETIRDILKENLEGISEGKKQLFSLVGKVEENKKRVIKYYNLSSSSSGDSDSIQQPTTKSRVSRKTRVIVNPRKGVLIKLSSILTYMVEKKEGSIDKKTLIELTGLKNFCEVHLASWKNSLSKIGIPLNSSLITIGKKTYLKIDDYKEVFIKINEYSLKNRQYDLNKENVLNTGGHKFSRIENTDQVHNRNKIYYIVSVSKYYGKALEIQNLSKCILDIYNVPITCKEIVEISRNELSEFVNLIGSNKIIFKGDWEKAKRLYSPINDCRKVLCRLTLGEEILKKFFEYECKSVINENDAIFEITYNSSKTSLFKWTMLYRMFRGVDKIFDENLVSRINEEIMVQNGKYKSNDIELEIENL